MNLSKTCSKTQTTYTLTTRLREEEIINPSRKDRFQTRCTSLKALPVITHSSCTEELKENKVWTRICTSLKIKEVKLRVKMIKNNTTHPVSKGKTNIDKLSMIQVKVKGAVCGPNGAEVLSNIPNP